MGRRKRRLILGVALAAALGLWAGWRYGRRFWVPVYYRLLGRRTADEVLADIGPAARARLAPAFRAAGCPLPPPALGLLAFKEERRLELWAAGPDGWRRVKDYPILGASGGPGPKLREGDGQVPEGDYRLTALNPNSSWHLSIRLDYPNEQDLARARADGRDNPGGDIFLHGFDASIGCLAIGNGPIEELFWLAGETGLENCRALIAPFDFRRRDYRQGLPGDPPWVADLYRELAAALADFPARAGN